MTDGDLSARWLRRLERGGQPIYLAIADAIEAAVREGELQAGDQLPPQRTVAELVGVDLTTITRAYAAARERGLVQGAVGRGTYVRAHAAEDDAGLVDLSMNLPPPPDGLSLASLLKQTVKEVLERTDVTTLMSYHSHPGTLGQRAAAVAWLGASLGDRHPDEILITPGAQTALAALLPAILSPGDGMVVEPLTYPGLLGLASQLGVRLIPCPVDAGGLQPEALARLLRDRAAKAVYLVPTGQNPTGTTLSVARRREIAEIVEKAGAWIIEDDPYARLYDTPPSAIAMFAPGRTLYVGTLSKCLSPGLRTAFLVTPDDAIRERISENLRAISLMSAPLMTAVAATWIREGVADCLLDGIRREARERRAIAARCLPAVVGDPEAIHVWLDLPEHSSDRLRSAAQKRGLSLVGSESFASTREHRPGVRISLGGSSSRFVLQEALQTIGSMISETPQRSGRLVV